MAGFCKDGKPWDEVYSFLTPLLNRPDNEGFLGAWDVEPMVNRLRQIVSTWPEDDYDRRHGEELVKAMKHVVEHRCAMVFG